MVSQFYQRKRRLAYIFAALSLLLLGGEYYLGTLIDIYSHPVVAADPTGVTILHRSQRPTESEGFRLIPLDPELAPLRDPYRSSGQARGVLRDRDGLTTFFANRFSVIRRGETVRSTGLEQKWEVRAAVLDRGRDSAWIFGWSEGKIVTRRRVLGTFSTATPVAESAYVNRISASMDGDVGPLVAWREEGSGTVSTALYDGTSYTSGESFDIGEIQHWDALRVDGRTVLLTYHRDDRTFQTITFRLRCCKACGKGPLPEKVEFADSVLLLGKVVTGIAAAERSGALIVAVTRWTTLQGGRVPFGVPQESPAPLLPLGAQPIWRVVVTAFTPLLMLFFSFSLVFLGFTLLRERGFFVLELINRPEEEGPKPAEILQRAMAYILDLIVIFPVYFVAVEVLNVSPETSSLDLTDPKFRSMVGVWYVLRFLYYFIGDAAFGRSIGKKIIGIRVVDLDGSPLSFRGALIRNLLRPIDAEFIMAFFGASVMITSKKRQRLGDRLAKTMVIQDERGPEAEEDEPVPSRRESAKRRN